MSRESEKSPAPSRLPAEPPRLRSGPGHVEAAGGPHCPGSRKGLWMWLCRGTRGRPYIHNTHTPLSRVEAHGEVSQDSEDRTRPRLALGEVSGSLFPSAPRLISGDDGSRTGHGNSEPRGKALGNGEAAHSPGRSRGRRGRPKPRCTGRRGARILSTGPGREQRNFLCQVPWRAGPPKCVPRPIPYRGLPLCLPGGGAESRKRPGAGWGRGGSRRDSTPSAWAGGGWCSLAGAKPGGASVCAVGSVQVSVQQNDLENASRLLFYLTHHRVCCWRGVLPSSAPCPLYRQQGAFKDDRGPCLREGGGRARSGSAANLGA